MAWSVVASPNASCQPCKLNCTGSPGRPRLTLFTTMKKIGASVASASSTSTTPPIHCHGAARIRAADWRTDRGRSVTAMRLASAPEQVDQHARRLGPLVDVVVEVIGVEVARALLGDAIGGHAVGDLHVGAPRRLADDLNHRLL